MCERTEFEVRAANSEDEAGVGTPARETSCRECGAAGRTAFPPCELKFKSPLCRACRAAKGRAYRSRTPRALLEIAADARKRAGAAMLRAFRPKDAQAVLDSWGGRCAFSGSNVNLRLLRLRPDEPLSVDNACPVRDGTARGWGYVIPAEQAAVARKTLAARLQMAEAATAVCEAEA